MIGTSLPLGVLTQNPACEADKRLLDDYGGIRALLAAFREMGVGAVELRSVKAHADAETLAACARGERQVRALLPNLRAAWAAALREKNAAQKTACRAAAAVLAAWDAERRERSRAET